MNHPNQYNHYHNNFSPILDVSGKLIEIMGNVKSHHRDIQLEKIFNDVEERTTNEKFIDEIREHLSTCSNRKDLIERDVFLEPTLFDVEEFGPQHKEAPRAFIHFLKLLHSEYKGISGYEPEKIFKEYILLHLNEKK